MIETFHMYMNCFEEERLIRVYLPDNYNQENKHFPVLYMHDGQNVFNDDEAIGNHSLQLEEFLDKHRIEMIVVAIDQNPAERQNEYCPWENGDFSKKIVGHISTTGGKGKQYIEFIVNDLKPYIDHKYRTLKDCNAMVGISLGGLISTYAACVFPNIFRNVAVLSSAFFRNQEEIEKLLIESDISQVEKFYLDAGTNEANNDKLVGAEFLSSNKTIYEIIEKKGINVKFEVIENGEHNYLFFRKRLPDVFAYFFRNETRK